jgi:putative FmdB family regulatory protein
MPLYEYHCSKCGKNFDVIQKFSDEPLTEHEGCGGTVEKLMSAPSFHLKGSGWYVTEYGKGGKVPASPDAKSEDSKSKEDGKSKKDSAAETKPSDGKAAATEPSATKSDKSDSKPASGTESKPAAAPAKSD